MFLFNIITSDIILYELDGFIIYCGQDTNSLPNLYTPIQADGIIIYCTQDASGLPTPWPT